MPLAVETALGGAAQNLVCEKEDDAKRAIAYLKENKGGRATFLPLTSVKGNLLSERGLENEPGFVGLASSLVTYDPAYEGVARSLLGRTAVAEDLDYAVTIARKYGYRFRIVTLDGQVVNAGGLHDRAARVPRGPGCCPAGRKLKASRRRPPFWAKRRGRPGSCSGSCSRKRPPPRRISPAPEASWPRHRRIASVWRARCAVWPSRRRPAAGRRRKPPPKSPL